MGIEAPLVTVVVPNWNTGSLLRVCLASLLHHSRVPARIVVVDNGSSDASRETAEGAADLGLVTRTPDDLDWEDEVRIAIEERASLSPDALTGMEQNLRAAGAETCDTKVFGRLSAWQNWIFQRPNAVGKRGALVMYGDPEKPVFDWTRT